MIKVKANQVIVETAGTSVDVCVPDDVEIMLGYGEITTETFQCGATKKVTHFRDNTNAKSSVKINIPPTQPMLTALETWLRDSNIAKNKVTVSDGAGYTKVFDEMSIESEPPINFNGTLDVTFTGKPIV